MANRKVLINRHTSSSGAPLATEMYLGEIAVAHETGKETLFTKNNAGNMVPFISCAQTISIVSGMIESVDVVYNVEKNPMFLTGQDCKGMLTTKKEALVYLVFKVSIPHEDVSRIMSNMVDMEKVRTLYGYGHGIKMLDFNSILKNE